MIPIYCLTSNITKHIVSIFVTLFNKYWPNQEVTILGYDKLEYNLPNNFSFISLGQEPENQYWTNGLIPYFTKMENKYFIIVLDDFFLIDYMDQNKLKYLFDITQKYNADKAMLHMCLNKSHDKEIEKDIILIGEEREYKTTLHPAIWKKDMWLYYLQPNLTAWQFEWQNQTGKTDNFKIFSIKGQQKYAVSLEDKHLYNCINYYRERKVNMNSDGIKAIINQEDLEIIRKNLND